MYHTDETHFYQPDDSKVTGRLLKEKSKLSFVDVLIKIFIACLLKEVKNSFFLSDTLIYAICRDGLTNHNIRACEHMILGQLRMGARQMTYAPLYY